MVNPNQEEKEYIQYQIGKTTNKNEPGKLLKAPCVGRFHSMLDIILFDPMLQFDMKLQCKNHVEEEVIYFVPTTSWTDFGHAPPRIIMGISKNIYLVSRIYRCPLKSCNVHLRATTKTILEQLPTDVPLDFLLLKRTCITSELYNLIICNASSGIPFTTIEKQLKEMKKIHFNQGGIQ